MKVTIKEWNGVATWRWDMPEDDVCGICRVQFDGTCPTCKFPGDDCSLPLSDDLDPTRIFKGALSDVSSKIRMETRR
ncbi:anaphase-promoting complex subunit 11 RING-H2 finger-domain-containing protein [Aspergillus tamarii]|uniref:Anaphase-promoting complex subunit 11 RING-H2 finger-domain-containing protein n=1 Tax=Aspergillus tamarii TaxID=41984 RepID=A0A5N6V935_ASPTM|nr:anaphase-promoting complex subunit 11 RING-H2 finger-domain-containing protein [Aspergillus tamarii]